MAELDASQVIIKYNDRVAKLFHEVIMLESHRDILLQEIEELKKTIEAMDNSEKI